MMMDMQNILRIKLIFLLFLTTQSCTVKELGELNLYMSSFSESGSFPTATELSIEDNRLYKLDFDKLEFRILTSMEKDSLDYLISTIPEDKLHSTHYKHLARYNHIVDISIKNGIKDISLSIYDSILPIQIKGTHDYLMSISGKGYLTEVKDGLSLFENIYLHRLVNKNGDTIKPSKETYFRLQKTLLVTKKENWKTFEKPRKVIYEILFRNFKDENYELESLGITEDNLLFYKRKHDDQYYSTDFNFEVNLFPEYSPNL